MTATMKEFASPLFSIDDFLCTFGCSDIESQVCSILNEALQTNSAPKFPEVMYCRKRDHSCAWTPDEITKRLTERGIWQAYGAKIAWRCTHPSV